MKPRIFALAASLAIAFGFPTRAIARPFNFHLLLTGRIELNRREWQDYQPVQPIARLYPGDLLRSGQQRIRVLCADLRLREVRDEKVRDVEEICPSLPQGSPRTDRGELTVIRSGTSPDIPYLISPRNNTSLLAERPLLRWNAIPQATSYRVQVIGPGISWETRTPKTEVEYGGPSLARGQRYWTFVCADRGPCSLSEAGGSERSGFQVLAAEDRSQFQAELNRLNSLPLSSEEKAIAQSHLYRTYGLDAEAIALLELAGDRTPTSAAIWQLLADLYRESRLYERSQANYEKAFQQLDRSANLEAYAEVQVGLGQASYALGNDDRAIAWFARAAANFRDLGDRELAAELEAQIQAIVEAQTSQSGT